MKCIKAKIPVMLAGAVLALASFTSTNALALSTTGVTVDGIGSSNVVGTTATGGESVLGDGAVKYFIPLADGADCVYGVDCGTSADYGDGGYRKMSMFMRFDPVSTVVESTLSILFEDLDLFGANDPWYFVESINVLDDNGNSITGGRITDIGGLITGDKDTQQLLSLSLGVIQTNPFFLELVFKSKSKYYGKNTPEYLIATVESAAIPLPASLFLLVGGLAGLGVVSRRRVA